MFKRFRRLRINKNLRELVQENNISKNDFIYPLFVKSGEGIKKRDKLDARSLSNEP